MVTILHPCIEEFYDLSKLHTKGLILAMLDQNREGLWDYEVAQQVLAEYGYSGAYWRAEIRATLTDLFSGALIEETDCQLDQGEFFGKDKVLVKFRLTKFGQKRMLETGLKDSGEYNRQSRCNYE